MADQTTAPDKDGFTVEEFAYHGLVYTRANKLAGKLIDSAGEVMLFTWKAKTFKGLTPGEVFTIPAKRDQDGSASLSFGRAKYVRPIHPAEDRQAIVAASRAVEVAEKAAKTRATRQASDRKLETVMRPLREEYLSLGHGLPRVAFELLVLQALRGR